MVGGGGEKEKRKRSRREEGGEARRRRTSRRIKDGRKGGGCFATQKSRMTQRGCLYMRGKGGWRSQKQRTKLGNNREEVLK